MMKQKVIKSPAGMMLLAADDAGICSIHLAAEDLKQSKPCALLEQAACELEEYFEGKRRAFTFALSMQGTAFEKCVWQALLEIPYGEIRTYGQIAREIGMPKASRAVGRACAANPLLIAVPCHRVVAGTGALTGFAAGMQAKRTLLALEGHAITDNHIQMIG